MDKEDTPPEIYRPWPYTALAIIFAMTGLFYFYDVLLLARAGSLTLMTGWVFLSGIVVCLGLGWGLWQVQEWARVIVIWLCVLIMAATLFVVPFLVVIHPRGTALNPRVIFPGLFPFIAALVAFRTFKKKR